LLFWPSKTTYPTFKFTSLNDFHPRSQSQSESKVIEILSGISKLTLKPKSSGKEVSGLEINMKIKDELRSVEINQGEVRP
jgi:hypothetical protein